MLVRDYGGAASMMTGVRKRTGRPRFRQVHPICGLPLRGGWKPWPMKVPVEFRNGDAGPTAGSALQHVAAAARPFEGQPQG